MLGDCRAPYSRRVSERGGDILSKNAGNRFRTPNHYVQPHVARGPASTKELESRCYSCHQAKTERDRRSGRLKLSEP